MKVTQFLLILLWTPDDFQKTRVLMVTDTNFVYLSQKHSMAPDHDAIFFICQKNIVQLLTATLRLRQS